MYRDYIVKKISSGEIDIEALRGKNLGCWCKPEDCHGDVLIELLESDDLKRDLNIEKKAVESGDGKDETISVSSPKSTAKGSNVAFSLMNVSSILQASKDSKNLVTKETMTKKASGAAENEDAAQKVKNPETRRMIVVGKGVYQKLMGKGYVLIDGNLVKGKTE